MERQNYGNHRRLDPAYHFSYILLTGITMICSIVNLIQAINKNENIFIAVLILLLSLLFSLTLRMIRPYPLKAQDRAIMAEEGLRHFILTGKRLDLSLTRSQIIALRFASDAEFPALCEKAAAEKLTPDAIKKAIVAWRADHFRI
jgi:hypothetical protein